MIKFVKFTQFKLSNFSHRKHKKMKRPLLYSFLFLSIISCNSKSNKKYEFFPVINEKFTLSGRYIELKNGVELINSAASVKTLVYGDSIFIHSKSLNEQHHYLSVEIGENYQGRFRINSNTLKFALPKNTQGTIITVYKDTEASNGSILFQGITAERISIPEIIEKSTIEFIGNSITCGMGADAREIACKDGEWYDQHNAYLAYGPRVARALNVDFLLNCVSGMGFYRNWNDENEAVMADVYPSLRLDGNTGEMSKKENTAPEVVSISLGTNDLSLGDGIKERTDFNQETFTQSYISFVEMIFRKYPNTKVALLSSPMIGEKENEILISSLRMVKEHFNKEEIFIYEFEKMEPGGCTSHPDIQDHEEMAKKLIPFFKEILN